MHMCAKRRTESHSVASGNQLHAECAAVSQALCCVGQGSCCLSRACQQCREPWHSTLRRRQCHRHSCLVQQQTIGHGESTRNQPQTFNRNISIKRTVHNAQLCMGDTWMNEFISHTCGYEDSWITVLCKQCNNNNNNNKCKITESISAEKYIKQ